MEEKTAEGTERVWKQRVVDEGERSLFSTGDPLREHPTRNYQNGVPLFNVFHKY